MKNIGKIMENYVCNTSQSITRVVNDVFNESHIKKEFVKKVRGYGIKGTSKHNRDSMHEAIHSIVRELPYNIVISTEFIKAGLLHPFEKGDIVTLKHHANNERFVVDEIIFTSSGKRRFRAKIISLSENKSYTLNAGALVKRSVDDTFHPNLLGKHKDYISQSDGVRLFEMLHNKIKSIPDFKGSSFDLSTDCDWYGGYLLSNLSVMLRRNNDFNKQLYKGEIRVHLHKESNNSFRYSTTLFLQYGGAFYGQNIDLFDHYEQSRFIYGKNYGHTISKAIDVFNSILIYAKRDKALLDEKINKLTIKHSA